MKIYHYERDTGAFIREEEAIQDSAYPSNITIPAHATTVAPPALTSPNTIQVFRGGRWTVEPDFRYVTLYSTETAEVVHPHVLPGNPLPDKVTQLDPGGVSYPMWDGARWAHDTVKAEETARKRLTDPAMMLMDNTLNILAQDNVRQDVLGVNILSDADRTILHDLITQLTQYLNSVKAVSANQISTFNMSLPTWPLPNPPGDLNVFTQANTGLRKLGIKQAIKEWRIQTRFNVGDLVYGTNGEGLFVVLRDFTSSTDIRNDMLQNNIVPVIHSDTGLRGTPVRDEQDLTALNAMDYEKRKVMSTGAEYVFSTGAVHGDIAANDGSGYWLKAIPETTPHLAVFSGVAAAANTTTITTAPQQEPVIPIVYAGSGVVPASDYTLDITTGIFTLTHALTIGDKWKVIFFE